VRPRVNIIGPMIARLRYERGWLQDDLVAKLQLRGCYMTRDILANIETCRCPVKDIQLRYFCVVLRVKVQELFPANFPDEKSLPENPDAFRIVTRKRRSPTDSTPSG
jgi:hypothetical protein